MEREKFLSAVYLIIKNEKNEVLFQRRSGTKLWNGFLGLPAGHIDIHENAYDALIREAKEELGITIKKDDIGSTFVVSRINKSLPPYYDVYFEIKKYEGTIRINEKEKCLELKWLDIDNLPNDVIDFEIDALEKYKKKIPFSVIYTDNEKKVD